MTSDFFDRGTAEPLKADAHGAMELLAVVFGVYNAIALLDRLRQGRFEWHLAVNLGIYGALILFERAKRAHHQDTRREVA